MGSALSRVTEPRGSVPFAALLLAVACLDPAAERASRDELVGKGESDGVTVDVQDGLAAVRAVARDRIELWQSAPALELTLAVSHGGPVEVLVSNTMPRSGLRLTDGGPVAIEALERDLPTRAVFRLQFDGPGERTFALVEPEGEVERPFRIGLMSDVQEAIDRVQDIYRLVNRDPDIEFLLGAGDLTEQGELQQLQRFERELSALRVPYYTTLGNHELGVTPPPYQTTFGRGSFSFVYRGVRFTLLDSASATIDPMVYGWLDRWLEAGKHDFHVVAMHVPPIDPIGVRNGSFASRNEANKLLAKLLSGEVDLTLYGHLHSYFEFQNAGIEARVSGGGGSIPERFDQIGRHFLAIDIDPAAQRFTSALVRVDPD